ncbi:MAG: pseudouridine synthase [Chloroflexota bacterium]|nr:pseudouridine synthase [Chloroflexota bacterium]
MIRLQKVMADRGVASRRAAEEMISEGRVRVNGDLITTLGTRVAEDAHIEVDGRLIAAPAPHRYVLLNKPVGIVSTANDEHGRRTVVDHIGANERLYPVGRLDTDSEGLLLLTNDGTWAERVLHPRYGHEREYDVAVEGDLTDEVLARLQRGIPLEEGIARAVRVSVRSRSRSRSRISVVLLTGWKRQVRRMLLAVGLKVARLVRVRMGPLELGKLRPGEFRDLTKREIDAMTSMSPKAEAPGPRDPARGGSPRREPVRSVAARGARRTPITRARVGPVESARAGAPRVGAPRPGAPRVTRRGPRAAAGPPARPVRGSVPRVAPARPPQWRRSTRAAAQRAAPRRAPR